jgi:uncharacterized protein YecE (DUF72 family)
LQWSRWLAEQRVQGRAVHVYFDNDQKSAAPKDALHLLSLLGEHHYGARKEQSQDPDTEPGFRVRPSAVPE